MTNATRIISSWYDWITRLANPLPTYLTLSKAQQSLPQDCIGQQADRMIQMDSERILGGCQGL